MPSPARSKSAGNWSCRVKTPQHKHKKFLKCSFFYKSVSRPIPGLWGSGQKCKWGLQATLSYPFPAHLIPQGSSFLLEGGRGHPMWYPEVPPSPSPKLCLAALGPKNVRIGDMFCPQEGDPKESPLRPQ